MRDVYFASNDVNGGIYHYIMKVQDKKVTFDFVEKADCPNPLYMYLDGNEMTVVLQHPYENSDHSALIRYELSEDGKFVRQIPVSEWKDVHVETKEGQMMLDTEGKEGCHMAAFEGNFYVANYFSASVYSTAGKTVVHEGHGPNVKRQEMAHVHAVYPTPDGKYLFSVDLGNDKIYTYDKDLNEISVVEAPAGAGPRHLVYSEDKKIVFCANELENSVSVYEYEDGKLTLKETVESIDHPVEFSKAAAIRRIGDYIYLSNRGDESIAAYRFENGKLNLLTVTPCGGVSPRDIEIFDGIMLSANEKPGSITALTVDGEKLELLDVELEIPGALAIVGR